jgi:hypothetical protein
VAESKHLIGRAEFIRWMGYFLLRQEREKEAIDKAIRDAKARRR